MLSVTVTFRMETVPVQIVKKKEVLKKSEKNLFFGESTGYLVVHTIMRRK